MLALSGLAFGLAMGTKQTLFFLLPGLALACLLFLWRGGRTVWRRLWMWAASGLAAFLLVGVYMFVVNFVSFGHPMGPETAVSAQTGGQTQQSLLQNLTYNSFRLAYQSIDPSGLPDPLWGYGFKLKALLVGSFTRAVGFPVEGNVAAAAGHSFALRERYVMQEDAAWYGPLFTFLVLPALIYQFISGLRRKEPARIGVFILCLSFLLMNAALRPGWDPFQGRYFIPVVTLAAPMAAFFYRRGGWLSMVARWAVVAVALVVMVNTFLYNSGKPITGSRTIWEMNWLDRATIQSFYMRDPARLVDQYVPADATLGLFTFGTYLEYPFFRADYDRRLVQIYPPSQMQDVDWLRGQGIEFVAVQRPPARLQLVVPGLPGDLVRVAEEGDWSLYTWSR
jgi:4-amino-4-deoxy-L-arabinose transferase-like glycosyltransferase